MLLVLSGLCPIADIWFGKNPLIIDLRSTDFVSASFDILRLYDLQEQQIFKHATVPFLIVPGHRTSVVSQLFIDPSCRYLLSSAGNRGWEGSVSEVLLGYEINCL